MQNLKLNFFYFLKCKHFWPKNKHAKIEMIIKLSNVPFLSKKRRFI